jgi:DNA topoisomerase-1
MTSTLQQEASRKLGLAPAQTMRIAQRLYEGVDIGGETVGLITYMRTDGVDMAPEAVQAARRVIAKEYGDRYVPGAPRRYTSKAKNAQEAHEAIRPTDMGRLPAQVKRYLEPEQARLYELIWIRTLASQMESAELERTTVEIDAAVGPRRLDLRATGQVIKFDGFLTLYQEGRDDDADEDEGRLPPMKAGDPLERRRIAATQHFTEPPPRYSEASLVKRMEELGIGRPSTYAAILQTLRDRDYVKIDKKRLVPEDKGRIVVAFLEAFFRRYVEYDFTADLEEQLDRVSNHEIDWKQVMREFWRDFSAPSARPRICAPPRCWKPSTSCSGPTSSRTAATAPIRAPARPAARQSLAEARASSAPSSAARTTRMPLHPPARRAANGEGDGTGENGGAPGRAPARATIPRPGQPVTVRDGPLRAPFVQLGEAATRRSRKRSSLRQGHEPGQPRPRDRAAAALACPAPVAKHPESGEPILVGIGRYGPTSSTARPLPIWRRTTTCWRSATTAPST